MSIQAVISGPHAHSMSSVTRVMLLVMMALFPATAFGLYRFGWPAINLFVITVVAAILFEIACLSTAKRPIAKHVLDGSAVLTGWLVAMTLPPWAPWWIGVLGSGIAIVIGKHVYGGLGQNLFNPAMVARVMLLISFPLHMTTWVLPAPLGSAGAPSFLEGLAITFLGTGKFDAVSSASVLGHVNTELGRGLALDTILPKTFSYSQLALGQVSGSLGETSAALILVGGLLLLATRTITWAIPFSILAMTALLATAFNLIDPARYPDAVFHLTSGALMLCAFFIATDYVTSPSTTAGQLIYGASTALLIFIIRTWASFPEGVGFAVLLMNACTPLIDHFVRPRVFGRNRSGKPLAVAAGDGK